MVLIGSPLVNRRLASIGCVAVTVNRTLVLRVWPTALTSCRATNWLLNILVLRSNALLRLVISSWGRPGATVLRTIVVFCSAYV